MNVKRILRIALIVAMIGVFAFGVYSANKPVSNNKKVWNMQMTKGNPDAKNYFVVYTDIMCPYCIALENALIENEEKFEAYLEENDVLFEVKLTDFLFEFGASRPMNSRYSAVAAYCAMDENKFWDYYTHVITTIWNGYFKDSGKAGVSQMEAINKDYWINLGKEVGLGDSFETCVREDKTLSRVTENTAKTQKEDVAGLPYIVLNKYVAPGFDLSWGWDYAEYFFDKGLESVK